MKHGLKLPKMYRIVFSSLSLFAILCSCTRTSLVMCLVLTAIALRNIVSTVDIIDIFVVSRNMHSYLQLYKAIILKHETILKLKPMMKLHLRTEIFRNHDHIKNRGCQLRHPLLMDGCFSELSRAQLISAIRPFTYMSYSRGTPCDPHTYTPPGEETT